MSKFIPIKCYIPSISLEFPYVKKHKIFAAVQSVIKAPEVLNPWKSLIKPIDPLYSYYIPTIPPSIPWVKLILYLYNIL